MNSETISTIAMEPFINKFILTVIKTIRKHHLSHEQRHVIDADLVPNVSREVMHASLMEKKIPAAVEIVVPKIPKHQHRDMSMLIAPMNHRPIRHHPMHLPPKTTPQPMAPSKSFAPVAPQGDAVPQKAFELARPEGDPFVVGVSPIHGEVSLSADYGKITPLLNDPSVSSIECQGHGKALMIIRAGQRQITRIVLDADDIKGILQKVSDTIHIPLLEGVFRAAADNFSINAVISEMIGSRFVIKKQTPYAMLEPHP